MQAFDFDSIERPGVGVTGRSGRGWDWDGLFGRSTALSGNNSGGEDQQHHNVFHSGGKACGYYLQDNARNRLD
jgi:hypothetical protein